MRKNNQLLDSTHTKSRFEQRYAQNMADTSQRKAILLQLALAISACLIFGYLTFQVKNAVVFHDEFVYKYWIDFAFSEPKPYSGDYPPVAPNLLYFRIYEAASLFKSNWHQAAQLINVLFWVGSIYFIAKIARVLGVSNTAQSAIVLLSLALPGISYIEYLMPESQYLFFFSGTTYCFLAGLFGRGTRYLVASGLLTGCLYFTKPHAGIIFLFNSAFLLIQARNNKKLFAHLGAYVFGSLVAYLAIKYLIAPTNQTSSLGIYQQMLIGVAENLIRGASNLGNAIPLLLKIFAAHILLPTTLLLPLILTSPLRQTDRATDATFRIFKVYTLFLSLALICMSVFFTYAANEGSRIHTRYYFFLWPLWLALAAKLVESPTKDARPSIFAFIAAACLPITLLYYTRNYSDILHISVVSDSPEYGFLFLNRLYLSIVLSLLIVCSFIYLKYRKITPYIAACLVVFASSTYYVRNLQGGVFAGTYTNSEEAAIYNKRYTSIELGELHLLGTSIDQVTKFLFHLDGYPSFDIAHSETIESRDFSHLETVIILDAQIPPPNTHRCTKISAHTRECKIDIP